MRPTATRQSALRCPLNDILGSEANVRILRALFASQSPLARSDLARAAALSPTGARRALEALVETGVVEMMGAGRVLYRVSGRQQLLQPLRALFEAEAAFAERIEADLRELISKLDPPPLAAWIDGPFADGRDQVNEPLRVIVVADAALLGRVEEQLRRKFGELEAEFGIVIDLALWTRADFEVAFKADRSEAIILLQGAPPNSLLPSKGNERGRGRQGRNHASVDRELLELGRHLAKIVRSDPDLLSRAALRLKKRLVLAPDVPSDVTEWLHILEHNSPAQVARLLEGQSERSTRLRQSPVLVSALTPNQRQKLDRALGRGHRSEAGVLP
jgi:hypothetical protein